MTDKMNEREMPERFWAGIWPSHFREWWHTESQGCSCRAEYIRADIAEQREAELVRGLEDECRIEKQEQRIRELEHALRIIAGQEQCLDNLMSNVEIAMAALESDETQNTPRPVE